MYAQFYIVARSRKHCCHGNTTIYSLFIVFDVDVAINNVKVLCCQRNATIGSLLLLSSKKVFRTAVEQQEILNIMTACLYS
jgi:hypothetical protein